MTTRLITPPATEPVTVAQIKIDCHIDDTGEAGTDAAVNEMLGSLISSMRETCEHLIGRSIMPQTWEKVIDSFPSDNDIELFNSPIVSITSIKYIDALTANETTLASDQYSLDKDSEPGWVMPAFGITWPATLEVANAVRVRYLAGYADAASVPNNIKLWIRSAVKHVYENCGGEGSHELPYGFNSGLLDRVRIWRL